MENDVGLEVQLVEIHQAALNEFRGACLELSEVAENHAQIGYAWRGRSHLRVKVKTSSRISVCVLFFCVSVCA